MSNNGFIKMTEQEQREWKLENKMIKAIRRYMKSRKYLLSINFDIRVNKAQYEVSIHKIESEE